MHAWGGDVSSWVNYRSGRDGFGGFLPLLRDGSEGDERRVYSRYQEEKRRLVQKLFVLKTYASGEVLKGGRGLGLCGREKGSDWGYWCRWKAQVSVRRFQSQLEDLRSFFRRYRFYRRGWGDLQQKCFVMRKECEKLGCVIVDGSRGRRSFDDEYNV